MTGRLLLSGPGPAAWNMAVDEAILLHHSQGCFTPTLRLYRWAPAAVSIGYFQVLHTNVDLVACRALGLDLVRRPTGGRAVLHEHEATYSIVTSQQLLPGGILETYRRLSAGLLSGLSRLGLAAELAPAVVRRGRAATAACFDAPSRYELVFGGRKIAGSAQVRRRGAILQHGSIPLEFDSHKLLAVLRQGDTSLPDKGIGVNEALGRCIPLEQVEAALVAGFAEALGVEFVEGSLSPQEEGTARRLVREKYGAAEWIEVR